MVGWMDVYFFNWSPKTQSFSIIINSLIIQGTVCIHKMYILPPNALRRDCNGKCIELIEGHALEVVVEVYLVSIMVQKLI